LALTHDHVGQILTLANRALAADTAEDRFVTLLLARLDPARRFLVYANAGHPSGYVLARDGSLRAALESTSVPLGLERDGVFAAAPGIVLEPGDIVFLLTDGVVEAAGPNDEVFGTERALDVIRTHRHRSAQEIIAQLYNELRRFSGDRPPLDDITAVIVKLNDSGA
jgi:serine phosphatase RsbU (regulator of sigma subunit)